MQDVADRILEFEYSRYWGNQSYTVESLCRQSAELLCGEALTGVWKPAMWLTNIYGIRFYGYQDRLYTILSGTHKSDKRVVLGQVTEDSLSIMSYVFTMVVADIVGTFHDLPEFDAKVKAQCDLALSKFFNEDISPLSNEDIDLLREILKSYD
jgi:hypothetical protein